MAMTATPNIDPDTAQFLAWLKDRLAAAEARGYQRGAAAARQVDAELTALAEENEKLRAELRSEVSKIDEVERSAEASRLDRALDLLERLVAAAERSAEAAERECELSDTSCGFFPRRFRRVEVDHGR